MRTFFIIAASALLLAAVTVELSSRLWPGSELALLIIATLVITFQGYLSLRVARPTTQTSKAARPARKENDRQPRSRSTASSDRETGTVKWFNRTKGFGFIVRESGEEIFVHQRSIRSSNGDDARRRATLRDGERVTFTVAKREKGLQAEDVAPD